MKRIIILLGFGFALTIHVSCVEESLEEYEEKEKQITTRSAENREQYYDELSKLFWEDMDSQVKDKAATQYTTQSVSAAPFTHSLILSLGRNKSIYLGIEKILILVNSEIYAQLPMEIERYAYDIHTAYGCQIILERVSGGNHLNIKDLIQTNRRDLDGVIFFGDFPAAMYEINDDHGKPGSYAYWPCDLFFMDLNGIWSDTDGNNRYDTHTGHILPEIFLARISTKNMGKLVAEIDGLKNYLDKDHDFWRGAIKLNRKYALAYTDKDWAKYSNFKSDIQYLYGFDNCFSKSYGQPGFGSQEYLYYLRSKTYEFIQIACHATNFRLEMTGGWIYSDELFNNGTEAIGYNLYCCSACDWTTVNPNSEYGFLAGSHIYSKGRTLVVVGSTKTGSMQQFDKFYSVLSRGKSVGESLLTWWKTIYLPKAPEYIWWFYGMTIIGDPMINFYYEVKNPINVTFDRFDENDMATHRYVTASKNITATNYFIPAGKTVIFNAPSVVLNSGFSCSPDSELIFNNI